jgi:signal transduction histidine kinase
MLAAWSNLLRSLVDGADAEPLVLERSDRLVSPHVDDLPQRMQAFALVQATADSVLQHVVRGADGGIQCAGLADDRGVVLTSVPSDTSATSYSPGAPLYDGSEPSRALERGRLVLLGHRESGSCDLLVPVTTSSRLRAMLACRFASVPPSRAVVALALQAGHTMAQAVEIADIRAHYDRVIATVGHELRQPLSALVTSLELAGRTSSEAAARPLDVARRQAAHATRIIETVLDASRLVGRRSRLSLRRLDVRNVLQAAVESVRDDVHARQQRLALHLPHGPVWCLGDAARLQQVFVNLLTNANRYTPERGAIMITLRATRQGVTVKVKDTGVGIDRSIHDRIFDAFNRSASGSTEGLGLGLAISRGIVEGHGGTIDVESPGPGEGSTFTVRLPGLIHGVRPRMVSSTSARGKRKQLG